VNHADLTRKTCRYPPHSLRRQRDLWDQKQRLPSLRQYQVNRPQVNLRLAAARYAVQQEDLRPHPSPPRPRGMLRNQQGGSRIGDVFCFVA